MDVSKPLALTVSKQGFASETFQVSFGQGETTKTIPVTLKPKPEGGNAVLIVETEPAGAIVFLNAKEVGVSPLKLEELEAGKTYEVELRKAGYKGL